MIFKTLAISKFVYLALITNEKLQKMQKNYGETHVLK